MRALERIYCKCREALTKVGTDCNNETLHELRKQVKYLKEAMKRLDQSGCAHVTKPIEGAEEIADDLGADHDLAVLDDRIAPHKATMGGDRKEVHALFERRRAELQRKALKNARLLLDKKPRTFGEHL
jgi:CHAD domain-containing protein